LIRKKKKKKKKKMMMMMKKRGGRHREEKQLPEKEIHSHPSWDRVKQVTSNIQVSHL